MKGKADVLGIPVDNVTISSAAELLIKMMNSDGGGIVNFINAHCANIAQSDSDYRSVLDDCDYLFGDGSGVSIASWMCGQPLVDNVNGTDLAPLLFEEMAQKELSLYLIGGRPGVAKEVSDKLLEKFPQLHIVGLTHGYHNDTAWQAVISDLDEKKPHLVMVAMGVPLQEKWIAKWAHKLPNSVFMGVGGLFDFLSQRIPRAPQWLRKIGMEWSYRLYQEPSRMWRRYIIGNVLFLMRALRHSVLSGTMASA